MQRYFHIWALFLLLKTLRHWSVGTVPPVRTEIVSSINLGRKIFTEFYIEQAWWKQVNVVFICLLILGKAKYLELFISNNVIDVLSFLSLLPDKLTGKKIFGVKKVHRRWGCLGRWWYSIERDSTAWERKQIKPVYVSKGCKDCITAYMYMKYMEVNRGVCANGVIIVKMATFISSLKC